MLIVVLGVGEKTKMFTRCTSFINRAQTPSGAPRRAQKNKTSVYIGLWGELPNTVAWRWGGSKLQNNHHFTNDLLTDTHLPVRIFSAGNTPVAQHHWGATPHPVPAVGASQRQGERPAWGMDQGISSRL